MKRALVEWGLAIYLGLVLVWAVRLARPRRPRPPKSCHNCYREYQPGIVGCPHCGEGRTWHA